MKYIYVIIKRQYFGNKLHEEVVGRDLWSKEEGERRAHSLSGCNNRIGYEARPATSEQLATFEPITFSQETKGWIRVSR